ncbi:aldehyde oxidase GLOX-like [Actinidia eriantha]|uniref:aldehyde oxidase GLOX-like n=1 Tax=Actinidia eriantha TaxID=165200 RepID=UPI00258A5157|nr:aldehyde oxidase GLOX-like [Actinidia eriantha]
MIQIYPKCDRAREEREARKLCTAMAHSKINISFVFSIIATFSLPAAADVASSGGGEWILLHRSVGISAMHMQILHNNKVVIFDRTDFGVSNISLPAGKPCRRNDAVLKRDCSAHSLLYDPASNTYRPLTVHTNVWCSSGAVHPDGTLVQTGGYSTGEKKIRLFSPAVASVPSSGDDRSDWKELPEDLLVRRWYATNHILPDGRVVVVGGRRQFNYEFFPKTPSSSALYDLQFLNETNDPREENNLYPFLHLLPDGNLFVFANRRSISLDYINNRIVREFPVISGEKRNYPSTGSSVLLPLKGRFPAAEVLVCGGAPNLSFTKAHRMKIYVEASNTCGRLRVTDSDPQWVMEKMPMGRVMGDMILLPSGDILIINGASNGTAGWENAVRPVLNPVLYRPTESDPTKRFAVMSASTIPRLYHSTAILLPDGRILVGGSNPHVKYNFTAPYPTDLSLEAFFPRYMAPQYSDLRPWILYVGASGRIVSYGQRFSVAFKVANYRSDKETTVSMIAPPFATHSFSMNQRMIYLDFMGGVRKVPAGYKVKVIAPATRNVAPPGYYMMFVVHGGIPGECVWIKVNH